LRGENSITRRTGRSEPIRNFDYCEVDLWQYGRIVFRALVVNGVGDGLNKESVIGSYGLVINTRKKFRKLPPRK
jgi:hypothetical protein